VYKSPGAVGTATVTAATSGASTSVTVTIVTQLPTPGTLVATTTSMSEIDLSGRQ
jgi:hypothetical protein